MVFIVSTKGMLFLKPPVRKHSLDRFVVRTLPRKGHKKIKESKGSHALIRLEVSFFLNTCCKHTPRRPLAALSVWVSVLRVSSRRFPGTDQQSYLVDPASSDMLVSKIKPCMSKYKQLYTVKLRTAHYISNNLFDGTLLHGYP